MNEITNIAITRELHNRLTKYAEVFDCTPADVIEKFLNYFENSNSLPANDVALPPSPQAATSLSNPANNIGAIVSIPGRLEIIYFPDNDEEKFKKQFLETKIAYIQIFYTHQEPEIQTWGLYRFQAESSVSGNLRTGRLRNWRKRGIIKAKVSVNKSDFDN